MLNAELFNGPVDGLRLRLPAWNNCFVFSVNCIRNGTVLVMNSVYIKTEKRTREGFIIYELQEGG